MVNVLDIPVAHTPEGGWHGDMPLPILAGCTEALVEGAPDLRGTWRAVDVRVNGERPPDVFPMWKHVERIEQAGNRVVVTAGGVIHDMQADGTYEHGVNDVAGGDFKTVISVAATFEDDVLVLRPRGMAGVEVRQWREGERLVWAYHTQFTAWLARIGNEDLK